MNWSLCRAISTCSSSSSSVCAGLQCVLVLSVCLVGGCVCVSVCWSAACAQCVCWSSVCAQCVCWSSVCAQCVCWSSVCAQCVCWSSVCAQCVCWSSVCAQCVCWSCVCMCVRWSLVCVLVLSVCVLVLVPHKARQQPQQRIALPVQGSEHTHTRAHTHTAGTLRGHDLLESKGNKTWHIGPMNVCAASSLVSAMRIAEKANESGQVRQELKRLGHAEHGFLSHNAAAADLACTLPTFH